MRGRNWWFIAYPDSAPKDFIEVLKRKHIQFAVSPLHDKDVLAETEDEEKKAHWHIILKFEGNKSYNQVLEIAKSINGTIPKPIDSITGALQYFIHKNHPNKHQYDPADIQTFGSFDLSCLFVPTGEEQTRILAEIMRFCNDNKVTEYKILCDYCLLNGYKDWYYVITRSCTNSVKAYITSSRHILYPKEAKQ